MKKLFLLSLIILLLTELKSQSGYNIYEANKGELLKQDYEYLEHLFGDLYSATLKKTQSSGSGNSSGIIDEHEKILLPFKYSTVKKMWDHDSNPNTTYVSVGNLAERKGLGIYEIKNDSVHKIIDDYLKFGYFVFNKTCITAYAGRFDLFNLKTRAIVKTNFTDIEPLTDKFIITREPGSNWGVSDIHSNKILNHSYDRIRKLTDSLILIVRNDSMGVMNSNGKIVVPVIFNSIHVNANRIFAKKFDTAEPGLTAIFDEKGNAITSFEFENLNPGIAGNSIASQKNQFGILSPDGKILLPYKYSKIEAFFDKFYVIELNGMSKLLNADLKELFPVSSNKAPASANEAIVNEFFSNTYNKIIPISGNEVLLFEDKKWYKLRIKDNSKIEKHKLKFDDSYNFSPMQTPTLSNETVYSQDYFLILKDGLYGVVSKKFSVIIPPNYERNYSKGPFYTSYFEFIKDGKPIYFSLEGKELKDLDLSKSYYSGATENSVICIKNGKYGVIDNKGNVLVPFNYLEISTINGKKFIVKK